MGAKPKGDDDERAVLERTLQPDHLYLMDRGYAGKFALVETRSSPPKQLRSPRADNSVTRCSNPRAVTGSRRGKACCLTRSCNWRRACGESSGRIMLSESSGVRADAAHQPRSGQRRGSSTGPECDGVLRHRHQPAQYFAELISQLYRHRWSIEPFFRMFKQLLGCRHLLSTRQNGVEACAHMRNHRLPADPAAHLPHSDEADVRNDLLLSERLGQP